MWVCGFRFFFTPLTGVLFAFPSRYFCTIGRISYLALDRGRPGFQQGFSCPAVLRYRLRSLHHFAYGDFTLSVRLSQNLSAIMKFSITPPRLNALTALQPRSIERFRLFQFRSPLLSESLLISLPWVLRWFSSPSFASSTYVFSGRIIGSLLLGYPIRLSTDQRMLAPPRRFSQLTTAFFASIRQGIHRKPFSRLTILSFLLKSPNLFQPENLSMELASHSLLR